MRSRIGFYICHCGTNIAGKVAVAEVRDFIGETKDVVVARDYKFMCSDPGQEMIQKDIKELGLNRVVVASCSPRLHEKTFQAACGRAGLNPYFFQMACVREHCSWVTRDPAAATEKAKHLASAAVSRVNFHETLFTREVSVNPDVLVVGAGISGIQASLDIARSGCRVYLVEKEPSIGGHMVQFDKTFPTLDCAACISTPKTVAVAQSPNIELMSYSEVTEVKGFVGNFKVKVRRKPRFVIEDRCTGCGICAENCPVTVPNEFDENLGERKAVYRSFPQAVPITFAIDKKDTAPCRLTCPAGVNVQGYTQLIGLGKYKEAVELIMERLPLPGVLGRVCPHVCESSCRRTEVDTPISIRELKRFAADRVGPEDIQIPRIEDRPERVAVIGAGPAGLTAAYYLRLKGYGVAIFEALPAAGGMLKVGIPDYRLPPEVLDREIEHILGLGISLETGKRLGEDFTIEDLRQRGFQAIFVGIGAHKPLKLNIAGEHDFSAVVQATDFLRETNLGRREAPGKRVLVLGGGNVAIDAARTSLRLGSKEVTIVYRRTREEMPAYGEEIEEALLEGIKIAYLTAPVAVEGLDGKITGLRCVKNELGPPDESGRRRPVPKEGSEFVIECDAVVPAIGQEPDSQCCIASGLEVGRRGRISASSRFGQTSAPDVFAAGDAVLGPATVIEAVGAAREAAEAIDRFLRGEELEAQAPKAVAENGGNWREIPKDVVHYPRASGRMLEPEMARSSFAEVNLGLSEEAAMAEAAKCLNCGVCSECMECVRACERGAIDHSMSAEEREIQVGSIILATGFDTMDASRFTNYGYGRFDNVYTGLEFERLNNAVGPTGGQIVLKNGKKPESVAIVHCVGSRDENHRVYCSRVCCMYALKYGHLVKEKAGHDTKVHNFYIDMRCYGKGYEEFYRRLQEEGINFVRGKPAEIVEEVLDSGEKKLIVVGEDTLLGRKVRIPVDMVVLCTALEARKDASEVARIFGINQGGDGFFLEEHPKLGPVSTPTDGIFLAGVCQGPKDIPDAVSHAAGAAAQALALSMRGKVEVSPVTSWIDPEICMGCQTCIKLCPYSAIEFNARMGISEVNEAVCKGCGSCAGFCPSGAARVKHFSPKQVLAEIDGILGEVF
ncbi:MAG: FAD-dependent oxidoreductase [Syntrophobacteraceae bacterium]|nr:FAD-dependent oxidoreductase [Syntrophobacteraceae bacterium]